jgi:hypothetical protein
MVGYAPIMAFTLSLNSTGANPPYNSSSQSSAGPDHDRARASTSLLFSFFRSPQRESRPQRASPLRGMERRDGALVLGHPCGMPARLSGDVRALMTPGRAPPGAPSRRCYRPGAGRLGLLCRLPPSPQPANGSRSGLNAGGRIPGTPGSLRFVDEGPQAPQSPLRRRTTPEVRRP